jgi:hypothetical protein
MPENIIARVVERKVIVDALSSREPELAAVWGRRRVGKTFLIRNSRPTTGYYFELVGTKDGKLHEQLFNFSQALARTFPIAGASSPPSSWGQAFALLASILDTQATGSEPIMLFFDEAPWLDTRKSGFLNALEHFWNAWGSTQKRVKLFVCGSSSSWILKKIVRGKGGWHGRATRKIHLHPFTLAESGEYLASRGIKLSAADLIEVYMALGGTALYLKQVPRGAGVGAALDQICFQREGALRDEFNELFHSLFDSAPEYIKIVTALASSRTGLTKTQIRAKTHLASGRQFKQALDNLCDTDFVRTYQPFQKPGIRYRTYRLSDFFSLFHLRWMETPPRRGGNWQVIHGSPTYRAWAGLTFEMLVWNHIDCLLREVGLQHIPVQITKWRYAPKDPNDTGAEIDLLVDADKAGLYILELKARDKPFEITKDENRTLLAKRRALENATKSRRSIFVHMLATHGVVHNTYAQDTVDYIYDVESLLRG